MKKLPTIIAASIAVLAILFPSCRNNSVQSDKSQYNYSFRSVTLRDSVEYITYGLLPPVPTRETDIVNTPDVAVAISSCVLIPVYGKEVIEREQPFNVLLINDSIWHVSGSLAEGHVGGVFSIALRKKDGAVLWYMHEK